jgi:hypothetical protein
VPYSSFLHLLETKDQEVALKAIRNHLDEDGLFSFAVFSPRLDRPEQLLRHRGTRLTPQGEIISWFESQIFDQPSQRTTVTYFYDISRQDKPLRRVTSVFTLRYLFHREALEMLSRCGFEVTAGQRTGVRVVPPGRGVGGGGGSALHPAAAGRRSTHRGGRR